ncbi:hypothetical protein HGG76_15300 [Ochrobactrum tritici]|uniref:Uncharacterized protein n=1 Tax=Brucella tritici TaxID=94626 RepID=A0A7X6FQV9_9HYPH|nr:hypothetical protein [Brucella tritici]
MSDVEKNSKGATDRMAKTMMKGIVGDWAEFEASVENLFVSIAESGVLKTASEAFKLAADGLKSLAQSNPKLLEFGTYALMIAGVLGPIAIVGGGVISFFTSLLAMLLLVTKIGRGALGVAGAAMGISGPLAQPGLERPPQAAARWRSVEGSSLLGKAAKGAGIIGTAWTIKEVLDAVDPEGNLWGLTSGIDAWIESKTGINPSKVGGSQRVGPEATPEEGRAHDISEWQARQAEIDARLAQIEKNTHPAMRDMPNIERTTCRPSAQCSISKSMRQYRSRNLPRLRRPLNKRWTDTTPHYRPNFRPPRRRLTRSWRASNRKWRRPLAR